MKKKILVLIISLISTPYVYAAPTLLEGDTLFCEAQNKTSLQIIISKMGNQPKRGEAKVSLIDSFGSTREFSGSNAQVVEAQDWLHVELRNLERVYANIKFRDSVVFGREVAGTLDYQNGNRTLLRCIHKR